MNFGNKLRALIDERSITQKELAAKLNIAPSTVSSYVQNTREPDFETLRLIARYFDVSADYLLDCRVKDSADLQESEMLRIFRALTPDQRDICIEQSRAFLKISLKKKSKFSN